MDTPNVQKSLKNIAILGFVIIVLCVIYYITKSPNIDETFMDIDALFSTVEGVHAPQPLWSNFVKNANTQTEPRISILAPVIKDTITNRILGHSVINSYDVDSAKPPIVIAAIHGTDNCPNPISMRKIYDIGGTTANSIAAYLAATVNSQAALSAISSNSTTSSSALYTDVPLQYKNNVTNSMVPYYYGGDNDATHRVINKLNFANASKGDLNSELELLSIVNNKYNGLFYNKLTVFYQPKPITITVYADVAKKQLLGTYTYPIKVDNSVDITEFPVKTTSTYVLQIPLGVYIKFYQNSGNVGNVVATFGESLDANVIMLSNKIFSDISGNSRVSAGFAIYDGWLAAIGSMTYGLRDETVMALSRRYGANDTLNVLMAYIKTIRDQLNQRETLVKSIQSGTADYPAMSVWAPAAPDNFVAMGHVVIPNRPPAPNSNSGVESFVSSSSDTDVETLRKSIACVPIHCYRYVRDWAKTDIIWTAPANLPYIAFYWNTYTNTFIATTNPAGPEGYVGKLIPCPLKDYTIDNLITFDKKLRVNCGNLKKMTTSTPIISTDAIDTANTYMENKLHKNNLRIKELKAIVDDYQTNSDRGRIINQEYNRRRLATYLDEQKNIIDAALTKLETGRNKLDINIKYPAEILDTLASFIANNSDLSLEQKTGVLATLKNIKDSTDSTANSRNGVISALMTCPQFDLTGYVKKPLPCNGCNL
jgi:hypothetical protein